MAGPKSYFTPGRGYLNETNDRSFLVPGWGYVNEQLFFSASLALTQPAAGAAIAQKEKFLTSLAPAEGSLAASLAAAEKFFETLALTAPANSVDILGTGTQPMHRGNVSVGDEAQGGLLTLGNAAAGNVGATDAALYKIQITESV